LHDNDGNNKSRAGVGKVVKKNLDHAHEVNEIQQKGSPERTVLLFGLMKSWAFERLGL